MTAKDLSNQIIQFSSSYFLIDMRKDRNLYYNLSAEDLVNYPLSFCGYILNLIMDGNLQKADSIIESLPDESVYKAGLSIVNPKIDCKSFIKKSHF